MQKTEGGGDEKLLFQEYERSLNPKFRVPEPLNGKAVE